MNPRFTGLLGGTQTMREQLSNIIEIAALPNVTMQIVPFEAGAHPGLDNTFTLLEFNSAVQSPVAYVENLAGTFYLEREPEIVRYREVLEHLRACSLSPANSIKYVQEIRKKSHQELSKCTSEHHATSIRKEVHHVRLRDFIARYSMEDRS